MMVTFVKPSGSAVTVSVSYIHYAEPISPTLHYRRKLTVFILDIFNEDFRADSRTRTDNLEITRLSLCQLELYQHILNTYTDAPVALNLNYFNYATLYIVYASTK